MTNMLTENDFHRHADAMLAHMQEVIEQADEDAVLDVELQQGTLTVTLPDGRQYLINKHAASRQLWLASPLSGGLHFSFIAARDWQLADGRRITAVVEEEFSQLARIVVVF